MPKVVCCHRGADELDNAFQFIDEKKVQVLFTKFPIGSGTFKRNKFAYVQYTGSQIPVVKRGQGVNEIGSFIGNYLKGFAGFTTNDRSDLSFEGIVDRMRQVFITDYGSFSMDQIRQEYRSRLRDEQQMMYNEREKQAAQKAATKHAAEAKRPQVRRASKIVLPPKPKPEEESQYVVPNRTPEEWSALTKNVLESLRRNDGPVNWAVFEADPTTPRVASYGRGGIFEMVKNLPANKWLFGLFRISFSNGQHVERRMVFFQWIGNDLRTVRGSGTSGVYPAMAKLLSPFAYEIYLVGHNDLNAQAIINKSKTAFRDAGKKNLDTSATTTAGFTFTEDSYRNTLTQEMKATVGEDFEPFMVPKDGATIPPPSMEQSMATVATMATDEVTYYDIDETLELIKRTTGGLVWAIFSVE